MNRRNSDVSGRDRYIIAQALAYAHETIMRLPVRWQEYSNACDMRRILEASFRPQMVEMVTENVKRHLDGAETDPDMTGHSATLLRRFIVDHNREGGRR